MEPIRRPDQRTLHLVAPLVIAFIGQLVVVFMTASDLTPVGPLVFFGVAAGLAGRGAEGLVGLVVGGAAGAVIAVGLYAVAISYEDWQLGLFILEALVLIVLVPSYLVTRILARAASRAVGRSAARPPGPPPAR